MLLHDLFSPPALFPQSRDPTKSGMLRSALRVTRPYLHVSVLQVKSSIQIFTRSFPKAFPLMLPSAYVCYGTAAQGWLTCCVCCALHTGTELLPANLPKGFWGLTRMNLYFSQKCCISGTVIEQCSAPSPFENPSFCSIRSPSISNGRRKSMECRKGAWL